MLADLACMTLSLNRLLVFAFLLCSACAKTRQTDPPLQGGSDPTHLTGMAGMDIAALQAGYADGSFTVTQVVSELLARAENLESGLNAVIAFDPTAMAQARRLDSLGKLGLIGGTLHGVPVYIKDNIELAGNLPTTAGARVLANNRPNRDAAVVQRLRAAGAVILGKTNLSEWANFHSSYSSSGHSALGGQTRNPYDTTRSPCGSSAGSGVVVAAGYAPLAIGTETNGSIICPSQANGLVGLKPTVGLISRRGIIPIAESQDTPGPMTRSVADAARALNALQGVDSADRYTRAASAYVQRDYTKALAGREALRGKRIGLYTEPLGNHFRVDSLFNQTVRQLQAAGAIVIRIDTLTLRDAGRQSYDVLLYEFKAGVDAYLKSLPDAPFDSFGALVADVQASTEDRQQFDHDRLRQAIETGSLRDASYREARANSTAIYGAEGIDRVIAQYQLDALMAPAGGPAWKIDLLNGDHFSVGSSTPAAVAGYPNLTVPMGFIEGLPVGISFFGPAWSEPMLITIGSAWEDLSALRKQP